MKEPNNTTNQNTNKMELFTGKNKEQFEEFLQENFNDHYGYIFGDKEGELYACDCFPELPFEMQIGVILAYYDSLGVDIDIHKTNDNKYSALIDNRMIHQTEQNKWKTRNEAYKQAFIKADEIINKTI